MSISAATALSSTRAPACYPVKPSCRSGLARHTDQAESRRFPPPWTAEETEACFIVRDHNGQALAYVYFEEEPGRRAPANLLTRDEARGIAANIAKLPGFRQGGAVS